MRSVKVKSHLETDARYELARCYTQLRLPDQAARQYEKVLTLYPRHADASANLAFLLERENKLEQARQWAIHALEIAPQNTMADLALATVERREGQGDQASRRLKLMLKRPLSPVNRSIALNQLGQCLDQLGQYREAFMAFAESNDLLRQNHPYGTASTGGSYSFNTLHVIHHWLGHNPPSGWSKAPAADSVTPVFLVGFPRSGTTLLDRALSAHPDIEVLEEIELLDEVRSRWVERDSLDHLPQMSEQDIQQARASYLEALNKNRVKPDCPVIVDKLPLNLAYLFLIHRLFPEARILFILRDPRDVCLSCYFQSFDLQGAMPYFLNLTETANYYEAVMSLALDSLSLMGNPQHELKYENLVTDFESQMKQVISHLGLSWNRSVLEYRERNPDRRVDTPSYQQVILPLYTRSIGRWRNYADQMELVLPGLGPWVERLGYNTESRLS